MQGSHWTDADADMKATTMIGQTLGQNAATKGIQQTTIDSINGAGA